MKATRFSPLHGLLVFKQTDREAKQQQNKCKTQNTDILVLVFFSKDFPSWRTALFSDGDQHHSTSASVLSQNLCVNFPTLYAT